MNATLNPLVLDAAGWMQLVGYFLSLSLLSVGGAMATAPDMHRHMVEGNAWLSGEQFSTSTSISISISIAQAAPGPTSCLWPCWAGTLGSTPCPTKGR